MTAMSHRTVPNYVLNARRAETGVALAIGLIAAAAWIGVAAAGRPRLEPVDCNRLIPPHTSSVRDHAAMPASRYAAAKIGLSPSGLSGLEVESRLGVAGHDAC